MRKIFLTLAIIFSVLYASAETQQGYTKTRGKLDAKGQLIPGQRLSGVIVETDRGKVTSEKDGGFSLAIPNGKFVLKKVDLKGYILNDFEQLRQYSCSATPLALVLVKPDEYNTDKVEALRKINRTLRRTLQEREDEIDSLFEQQKISEQEKNALYQKLYADEQNSQKLVEEMAERYAKTDFDQIDEFQRQVTNLIINGELEKADSLLNTKGNIEEQIRENQQLDEANRREREELSQREDNLTKSEAFSTKTKEDLAARCYSKYEIYATKHKNDSAAYYLELRASIDTTNVEWQNETGDFIRDYLADYEKAIEYYQRGLRHSDSEEWQATFINNIGSIYDYQGDYSKALEYYEKSLAIRLSIFGDRHRDVAISYNNVGTVYSVKGDYAKALNYFEKALEIELNSGVQNARLATSYNNVGLAYYNLAIQLKYSGYQDLGIAGCAFDIDPFKYIEHVNNKAVKNFEKSLEIQLSIFGEQSKEVMSTYEFLSTAYLNSGNYKKSLKFYEKYLKLYVTINGVINATAAELYNNIHYLYEILGDTAKAEEYKKKAEEIKAALEQQ